MPMWTPSSTMKSKKTASVRAKVKKKDTKSNLLHTLLSDLLTVGINLAKHKL